MRQVTGLLLLGVLITFFRTNQAQNTKAMETQIKQTIETFATAGAVRNLDALEEVLHAEFRVLANRFGGKDALTVISREQYLSMMEAGKIGGNEVSVRFDKVSIHAHSAAAEVAFVSEAAEMQLFILLLQDEADTWKIASDMAVVVPR